MSKYVSEDIQIINRDGYDIVYKNNQFVEILEDKKVLNKDKVSIEIAREKSLKLMQRLDELVKNI